jgi:hypothetical protein
MWKSKPRVSARALAPDAALDPGQSGSGRSTPRLTGTGNITAMLSQGYIEAVVQDRRHAACRRAEAATARYPGIHLAAFATADAGAVHRRLAQQGFRVRPLARMERPADNNGAPGTAAFTVARVEPGEMPEGRIQMLTHHTESMVWQPRWLSHPNGALALARIVMAVADLPQATQRYATFTGRSPCAFPFGQTIALDRGYVDLVTPEGFRHMLPEVCLPCIPFMGACEIRVRSLSRLADMLKQAGIQTQPREGMLVAQYPAEIGQGAWLFRE